MQGMNLYEASKLYQPSATPPIKRIRAKREVILSAGVFNTPQLLKLSGIGPAKELKALGIDVVTNLPGVGENLQDRYEITINVELKDALKLFEPCQPFQPGDPCLTSWFTGDPSPWAGATFPFYGPYANNAAYNGRIAKSSPGRAVPDLFLVGQASAFHGFFPGFSQMPLGQNWTWLVVKAHTNNTAGTVKLRSTDPRKQPEITFHYFEEGNDSSGEDLDAVVTAMRLARGYVSDPQAAQHIEKETFPGPQYQTDAQLKTWIRDEAWGHHASCTAPIGAKHDPMAVLDSRFRVRGTAGLRVVDASAFPRVPGFFPVAAIFMIGEKAADVVLRHAKENGDDDDDGDD
jgi:choline dehydrogenase-like flavoprotein